MQHPTHYILYQDIIHYQYIIREIIYDISAELYTEL